MNSFIGKITWCSDIESIPGNYKEKVVFVCTEGNNSVAFILLGKDINKIRPFDIGDTVQVVYCLHSKEWKGKWYTDVFANDIQLVIRFKKKEQKLKPLDYFKGIVTKEQIKVRYRELCKKHHPDIGGKEEIMKEVNRQYAKLNL